MTNVNLKDMAFKFFWTMLPVVVGFVAVAVTDWNPSYGVFAAAVTQFVTSYARQQLGATPPDIQGLPADAKIEAKVVGS